MPGCLLTCSCVPSPSGMGVGSTTTVERTTVEPYRATHEPCASFARRPDSQISLLYDWGPPRLTAAVHGLEKAPVPLLLLPARVLLLLVLQVPSAASSAVGIVAKLWACSSAGHKGETLDARMRL